MSKEEFKEWRESMKISQSGAAELLGVTLSAVRQWERSARPIGKTVKILCRMYLETLK